MASASTAASGYAVSTIAAACSDFSGGAGAWREEGTETERILYTDVFGKYSTKNLQDGTYEITVSATSYQTYKVAEVLVQNSEIRYVEDIYMVERHDDFNTGSVEGMNRALNVEEIQDLVENQIMNQKA